MAVDPLAVLGCAVGDREDLPRSVVPVEQLLRRYSTGTRHLQHGLGVFLLGSSFGVGARLRLALSLVFHAQQLCRLVEEGYVGRGPGGSSRALKEDSIVRAHARRSRGE